MGNMEQAAIDEMVRRARENMVTHEILQFPLGKEIAAIYLSTERARRGKGMPADKEPGNIHTLEINNVRFRFWGFGILDFFLVENNIMAGDFIIVTRKEKNEKGFWTADFGFAKADGGPVGIAPAEGSVKNASGKKDKKSKA